MHSHAWAFAGWLPHHARQSQPSSNIHQLPGVHAFVNGERTHQRAEVLGKSLPFLLQRFGQPTVIKLCEPLDQGFASLMKVAQQLFVLRIPARHER